MRFSIWAISSDLSGHPLSHMNGGLLDALNKNNISRSFQVKLMKSQMALEL